MNILNLFKDPKKIEIIDQLKILGIEHYTIIQRSDHKYSVTINQSVVINQKRLKKCPIDIYKVYGNFTWHYSELNTMENMPVIVEGDYSIAFNKLKTLENSRCVSVKGIFNCSGNILKDLTGSPKTCDSFISNLCQLESLKGSPRIVKKDFYVSSNHLKTLEGGPNSVGGTYDCSNNNLENLYGIAKNCKKVISFNNPFHEKKTEIEYKDDVEKTNIVNIDYTQNFKEGDRVIYNKKDSKFDGFVGEIISCDSPSNEIPYVTYNIIFKKEELSKNKFFIETNDGKTIKDAIINNIKDKYLEKYVEDFKIDDYVEFCKPTSKYNGFKGTVFSKEYVSDGYLYKVKFEYKYNKGLIDVVSASNKNSTFINLSKIYPTELKKIKSLDLVDDTLKVGDKIKYIPGENEYYKSLDGSIVGINIDNTYNIKIMGINNRETILYNRKRHQLSKLDSENNQEVETLNVGDKIKFVAGDNYYNNLEGHIVRTYNYGKEFDISLNTKNGSIYLYNRKRGDLIKLKYEEEKEQEFTPKQKFSVNDEVIYVAKMGDTKNKEYHLFKGKVSYVNNYNDSCDVIIHKQKNLRDIFRLYNVPNDNIIYNTGKFNIGDKVVYENEYDDFNGKVGIISQKDNNLYNVTFNNGDETLTITNVPPDDLTKFKKIIGNEVHVNDDILYTRPDSKYYGCYGNVIKYNGNEDKPYEIEIHTKDNKIIKIKTIDDNLEKIKHERTFRKNDKIRYIYNGSPYDGFIGKITGVGIKNNYKTFEIELNSLNNKGTIYLSSVKPENLILLEEFVENDYKSRKLIFGDHVRYINPKSKHNDKIGEYQGDRVKDGVKQLIVKFDDGNRWLTVYVDEGTLLYDPKPLSKPNTTTTTTTTTTTKKKKKKEVEPEREPVLVYNRRNVSKKKYEKPQKLTSSEDEIAD